MFMIVQLKYLSSCLCTHLNLRQQFYFYSLVVMFICFTILSLDMFVFAVFSYFMLFVSWWCALDQMALDYSLAGKPAVVEFDLSFLILINRVILLRFLC